MTRDSVRRTSDLVQVRFKSASGKLGGVQFKEFLLHPEIAARLEGESRRFH
jgi:hypothetical protein